jgi:uncharacterized protein
MQGLRERVNTCRDRDGASDFNNFCQSQWMRGGPSREKPLPPGFKAFLAIQTYGIFYIPIDGSVPMPDFEWDAAKDRANRAKHGVGFELAQHAFLDPLRVIAEDLDHGGEEQRYFCFGRVEGAIMTVRFTWRNQKIRIFGAGYWRKGKAIYEKANG